MSLRAFLGVVGVVAGLLGFAFFFAVPATVHSAYGAGTANCKLGFYFDGRADDEKVSAEQMRITINQMQGLPTDRPTIIEQCQEVMNMRHLWTLPLMAVGAVLSIGARVVRAPRSEASGESSARGS